MSVTGKLFEELAAIFKRLRDPNGGCPWDLKQTHSTLKPYLVEEAYEALDAIDHAPDKIPEELGDVLLQVMLHSQIGSDEGKFSIDDVVSILSRKLITRHPHVFGEVKVDSAEGVIQNWEKIKQSEKKAEESILDGVPRGMPALLRCHRIGEKVGRVGFDWPTPGDIKTKVREELQEFLETDPGDKEHLAEEFGDLLFTLSQLARKLGLNSEELLQNANAKFTRRFKQLESKAGSDTASWTTERLEMLWQEVKAEEKSKT